MRTTFGLVGGLFAATLFIAAGAARGESTFTLDFTGGRRWGNNGTYTALNNGPFDYWTYWIDAPGDNRWELPGIELADSGTIYRLDETTAASYGVDWQQMVDDFFATSHFRLRAVYDQHTPAEHADVHIFHMEPSGWVLNWMETEFTMTTRIGNPATNSIQLLVTTNTRINVTGSPEPTSAALFLLGLCGAGLRFRSRRR